MSDDIEKIARLEQEINKQADEKIETILSEAKAKADEAVKCADEEYLEDSYHTVSGAVKDIKRRYERLVSQKSFEASRQVIAHRSGRVDEFFAQLEKRIKDYANTDEYADQLKEMLKSADTEHSFASGAVIYARRDDVEKIKKLYPNVSVEADKKIKLGGITVFYPTQGIYIDKTMDNAFELQKADFVNNAFMRL